MLNINIVILHDHGALPGAQCNIPVYQNVITLLITNSCKRILSGS